MLKVVSTSAMSDAQWVENMSWPKTGATHYHAQLGLPDKGGEINRISFLLCSVVMIYKGDGY